jgi:hypothetical protein
MTANLHNALTTLVDEVDADDVVARLRDVRAVAPAQVGDFLDDLCTVVDSRDGAPLVLHPAATARAQRYVAEGVVDARFEFVDALADLRGFADYVRQQGELFVFGLLRAWAAELETAGVGEILKLDVI